jgi:hypothetical protein
LVIIVKINEGLLWWINSQKTLFFLPLEMKRKDGVFFALGDYFVFNLMTTKETLTLMFNTGYFQVKV